MKTTLRSIIERYVKLQPQNSRGWHPCVHQGCDHGKKGARAAFIFNENGSVGFNCFNCAVDCSFDPTAGYSVSDDFIKVWRDFRIPEDHLNEFIFQALESGGIKKQKPISRTTDIEPKILTMPPTFYRLSEAPSTDLWAEIARIHLQEERGIDYHDYSFYLSEKTNDKQYSKWFKRLIIPMYKQDDLIFYQGRRLTDSLIKKYESPSTESSKILGGFDELFKQTDQPLIVAEGWFDGFVVNGVSIIGNTFSKEQIEWLNLSKRNKIYVPDKTGKGYIAAKMALQQGWKVSIPDTSDCKDISEAVKKYGKLYTLKSIMDNACLGFEAELKIKFLENA